MFDAFLLAAGHGTRLRPLTERLPKPLVPVCGAPMLDYALALCRAHGMRRVVVNAHHLAPAIVAWASTRPDVEVSVEAPEILGTGGGLRAVADRLGPRVAVVNGDTLCDVDLRALVAAVPDGGAALALRCDPLEAAERYGVVAFDADGAIVDLKGMARAEPVGEVRRDCHFTGIHALDRSVLDRLPPGASCIVRQGYLGVVPDRRIRAIVHAGTWLDVGDPAAYLDANLAVLGGAVRLPLDPWAAAAWSGDGPLPGGGRAVGRCWVGRGAEVRGSIQRSVVGVGATVPRGAEIADCVVWDGVEVPEGRWERAVFAGGEPLLVDRAARTVLVEG